MTPIISSTWLCKHMAHRLFLLLSERLFTLRNLLPLRYKRAASLFCSQVHGTTTFNNQLNHTIPMSLALLPPFYYHPLASLPSLSPPPHYPFPLLPFLLLLLLLLPLLLSFLDVNYSQCGVTRSDVWGERNCRDCFF